MPSKKRKYNARFPAGRIKKIMQTDEEVGKVAQAVPIIISSPRTLELFVESLLSKAMQVTLSRNAKTLSPSHVKQCILAESRFDFLRDLVKNIPDVSVAEEKEMMSAESSPNSSRYSDTSVPPRRIAREDSNSSSSSDIRLQQVPRDLKRAHSAETTTTPGPIGDVAIDLTTRPEDKPVRTANFYQETLVTDEVQHHSVITLNPSYATPQPSTSSYGAPELKKLVTAPKELKVYRNMSRSPPRSPMTPITPVTPGTPGTPNPILNIDFSKNVGKPEIKVLDTAVAGIVGVKNEKKLQRQNSKPQKPEKRPDPKPVALDIDHLNSGNLQIDEDYDT